MIKDSFQIKSFGKSILQFFLFLLPPRLTRNSLVLDGWIAVDDIVSNKPVLTILQGSCVLLSRLLHSVEPGNSSVLSSFVPLHAK